MPWRSAPGPKRLWLPDQRSGRSWGDRSAGFPALHCQGLPRQPIADPAPGPEERPGPCWLPHRNPGPPGSCASPRFHRLRSGFRSRYARAGIGRRAGIARLEPPFPAALPVPRRSSDAPTRCPRWESGTPRTTLPVGSRPFPQPAPLARIQRHLPASRPGLGVPLAGSTRPAATGWPRFPALGPGPRAHRAAHPWPPAPAPHRSPLGNRPQGLRSWCPVEPPACGSPPGCGPDHGAAGHPAAPACADARRSHAVRSPARWG